MALRSGLFAAILLFPAASHGADVYSGTLSFATQNQSLWGGGPAFQFDYSDFFGVAVNPAHVVISPGLASGGSGLTAWSVAPYLQFDTDFRLGIGVGANVNGGTIDANLDYAVSFQAPDGIVKGQPFSLSGVATRLASSRFTTLAPSASAYVDGIVDIYLGGYARFPTTGALGVHDYRMGNRGFTDGVTNNVPYRTLVNANLSPEIVSFNRNDNGQLKVVGVNRGGVGSTYSLGSTTITAGDWRVAPAGTVSNGILNGSDTTTLLTAALDVDRLATGGVPLLGTGFAHDWGVIAIDVGYEVVDLVATLRMGMRQSLTLDSTLAVTLSFSDDVLIGGLPTNTFTGRLDQLPEIVLLTDSVVVTPGFLVDAALRNDTDLTFNGGLALRLLEGHANASYDFEFLFANYSGTVLDQSLGPFYTWSDTIPLFDIGVFDQNFALSGFTVVQGEAFTLSAVPEPHFYLMLLAGLGLVSSRLRRHGQLRGRAF